jgi:hypothetical protein
MKLSLFFALLLAAPCLQAAAGPQAFLERYCHDCHDAEIKKGGVDLTALSFGDQNTESWIKISVLELEGRLQRNEAWENRPKPAGDYPQPKDIADANEVIAKSKLMFDLIRLALQTDSTRVVTLTLSTFSVVPHVPGVKNETHGLTHHGNEPEKIAELRCIESAQMAVFGGLLDSFRAVSETGGTLLDHTQVLYRSCLGNANSHSNQNLPLILAGGGFRHGQNLVYDKANNKPLANLFVTMLQGLALEVEKFSSSTSTLAEIKPA